MLVVKDRRAESARPILLSDLSPSVVHKKKLTQRAQTLPVSGTATETSENSQPRLPSAFPHFHTFLFYHTVFYME
jgi:hypothetical protein